MCAKNQPSYFLRSHHDFNQNVTVSYFHSQVSFPTVICYVIWVRDVIITLFLQGRGEGQTSCSVRVRFFDSRYCCNLAARLLSACKPCNWLSLLSLFSLCCPVFSGKVVTVFACEASRHGQGPQLCLLDFIFKYQTLISVPPKLVALKHNNTNFGTSII